jgi:membrane fusion protein (multidrug efflux system)
MTVFLENISHFMPETLKRLSFAARLLIVFAVAAAVSGCDSKKAAEEEARKAAKAQGPPPLRPTLVELEEAKLGMIEEILERSSPLEAEVKVQVLARTQNPAIELLVEKGDKVAKGQVLLRLENDRQTTDHEQAKSQLDQARIERDKQKRLYEQNLVSQTVYDNAEFAFKQAELRARSSKRELDYTEVLAPIKGTITSRTVRVGDSVNPGTPIFEIIDLESTVAIVHVPEQYLPKLKVDMEARLISTTFDDRVFPGFVKRISPIVEARAGTVEVVVGVRELRELRPGMWVDVELVLDSKDDALLIPKRAIVYDNTDKDGVKRAKRFLVEPENADKEHIEPKSGFEVGDKIIVAGQSGMKDDAAIREIGDPKTIEAPAAPGGKGAKKQVKVKPDKPEKPRGPGQVTGQGKKKKKNKKPFKP